MSGSNALIDLIIPSDRLTLEKELSDSDEHIYDKKALKNKRQSAMNKWPSHNKQISKACNSV